MFKNIKKIKIFIIQLGNIIKNAFAAHLKNIKIAVKDYNFQMQFPQMNSNNILKKKKKLNMMMNKKNGMMMINNKTKI